MRIFIAAHCHEASSFSPIPTSRRSFEEFEYFRPAKGEIEQRAKELNGYGAFVRRAIADGSEPILSSYSFAQPSAPLSKTGYESLRDEILDDLKAAGNIDVVLFFLHGAQTAEGYDDCEGDLIARAREIVGENIFIGALLDLHTNMSPEMIENATALVACRHYPHIDFNERGEHLYELAIAHSKGRIAPKPHYLRIPMLAMHYTTAPVMSQINAQALELQNGTDVLSVSLIHGFQWADIPHVGAGVYVLTDGDVDIASNIESLAQAFFDNREETRSMRLQIDEILDKVESLPTSDKPVVFADTCDNAGGGAGSDSTFILRRILDRGLTGYGVAIMWDPVIAEFAHDAGEGALLNVRLGGKTGPFAGEPIDATARVLCNKDEINQEGLGYVHPMGRSAALEIAGNIVIVSTIRGQVFSPNCFTDLGIDISSLRALCVKSSQHFHANFAPLASEIFYCDTPGSMSLSNIPQDMYKNIPRPMWPLDDITTF